MGLCWPGWLFLYDVCNYSSLLFSFLTPYWWFDCSIVRVHCYYCMYFCFLSFFLLVDSVVVFLSRCPLLPLLLLSILTVSWLLFPPFVFCFQMTKRLINNDATLIRFACFTWLDLLILTWSYHYNVSLQIFLTQSGTLFLSLWFVLWFNTLGVESCRIGEYFRKKRQLLSRVLILRDGPTTLVIVFLTLVKTFISFTFWCTWIIVIVYLLLPKSPLSWPLKM